MKRNNTIANNRSRAKVETQEAETIAPIIEALRRHGQIKEAHLATGLSQNSISNLYNHGLASKITVAKLLKWATPKTAA